MTSVGNWDEIFDEAEAERFIGREQELDAFHKQIYLSRPRYPIFYITGQGGVGKTTLLNRFREIARDAGFLLTDSDELQHDIPAVLGRFAHQLAEQGIALKHFDDLYKTYLQKMHEIENDPEAPQGLVGLLAKTVVRSAYIVGDMMPGVRKGLEYLPRESVESHADEWATYLAKKLTNKDEVALVRDPAPVLTDLFFADLNELTQKRKVLLCFENFEVTRSELQPWLLRLREYHPSLNIRIAIAGRDQPGARWDTLRNLTMTFRLDVFTEQEAEAFLDANTINNVKRRKEILEWSGRLPVFMSWLAAPEGVEPDPTIPTHDIVERFLRWINQPTLRNAALLAAIPRSFNLDILHQLLDQQQPVIDVSATFDWLQTMPFVQSRSDGWQYHPVVRRMMVHYQRQKSPVTYQHIHTTLANFYNIKRQVEPQWKHPQWRKNTLAYLYHYLVADPITHWSEVISIFALAIHKRRTFATQIIDLLGSDDIRDELSHEQNHIVLLFKQQLNAIKEQGIVAGFAMFDRLCSMQELDEQAQGYALAYRGMCHRMKDKPEQALIDLDKALSFITNDAWIIAHRGLVYEKQDNYPEALKNFDQAIDLDNKNIWIIVNRGYLHQTMGHYTEALADFNQAIALNERDGHAFAHRGAVYNNMGLYQEALADFNLAVALGYNDIWVLGQRAEIYGGLGRYEEALTDFTRIIALDPKNSHAFSHRGVAYSYLKRYEEASADFAQSILLKKKSNCAFIHRAEMHIQRGHYKDALTSLEEAIASDAIDFEDIANTIGLLLSYLGRYEDATAVYQRELQEDPDGFRALYNLAVSMVRWKGVHDSQSCIEKARVRLQQVLNTSARGNALYGLGGLDALTGNVDPALDYLEQALTLEEDAVDWASRDVAWLDLCTHPRFQSLIGSSRTNSVES